MNKYENEGWKAYEKGYDISDCPYTGGSNAIDWMAGWVNADAQKSLEEDEDIETIEIIINRTECSIHSVIVDGMKFIPEGD